jgi:hypothetical protein
MRVYIVVRTRTNAILVKFAVRLPSFGVLLFVFKLKHEFVDSQHSVAVRCPIEHMR